ncbi:MAG: hypothetical protein P8Y60_06455 [Calditrichota bacterium]
MGEQSALPLRYSMIFLIHGDGDYLYHDTQGNARSADKEAFIRAQMVAKQNPQAEVFIFYEIPRRHTLLFFPRRDGIFYHYRQGRLADAETYWRDRGHSRFDPEIKLYHEFRVKEQPQPVRLFSYFGHEIPEFGGTGYDSSYINRTFTVHDLANGLKHMTPDSTRFDLVVLSTCFNGTPFTIATLAPYA